MSSKLYKVKKSNNYRHNVEPIENLIVMDL